MSQKHETAAASLMQRIFTRQLAPGEKLPTEKQLSESMGLDRSSLRVALKLLESMGLLEIRQGDGMYVRDFLQSAGIDFLRLLFLQQADRAGQIIDAYLADELLEAWGLILIGMMRLAATRFSARDVKTLISILDDEARCIGERDRLVDFEEAEQDLIAHVVNNTVLLLLFNSFRPLRREMLRLFIHNVEEEMLRRHNRLKRDLLQAALSGQVDRGLELMEIFQQHIDYFRQVIRRSWVSQAPGDPLPPSR